MSAEAIFAQKKNYFAVFKKNQGGSDYFQTKINSWAKFKRNVFFDPKRTGPLLGRLRPKGAQFSRIVTFSTNEIRLWLGPDPIAKQPAFHRVFQSPDG